MTGSVGVISIMREDTLVIISTVVFYGFMSARNEGKKNNWQYRLCQAQTLYRQNFNISGNGAKNLFWFNICNTHRYWMININYL